MIFYYQIQRKIISLLTTFFNQVSMKSSSISCGRGFKSCGRILFRNYSGKGGITIGHHVGINSSAMSNPVGGCGRTIMMTHGDGKIIIGNHVGISNTVLFSINEIRIDDDVCIGAGTKIYDTDFHSVSPEYRLNGNVNIPSAPVYIGKRAFIGSNVIILKGVTIGEEAVVGAGSVVTKNVSPREIWAGNPAKFIKKISQN